MSGKLDGRNPEFSNIHSIPERFVKVEESEVVLLYYQYCL